MIETGLVLGVGLVYLLLCVVVLILVEIIWQQREQLSSCYKYIKELTKERNDLKWGSKNAD